jgi:uncharacterized protein involved in exopolysaccharide biosynthesis
MTETTTIAKEKIKQEHFTTAMNNSLVAFVRYLLGKWWLFLIVGALAGAAGIYYASKQKPVYKSRLTFALDDAKDAGISGALNFAASLGLSVGNGTDLFSGDNILEILKSRRMVEAVLLSADTFDNKPTTLIDYMRSLEAGEEEDPESVKFPIGQDRSTFSYKQDSVLYFTYQHFITTNLTAQRPNKKLSIYEVNVTSPSEQLSKVLTERLVFATNNFYVDLTSKKARNTLQVLEQRVASMKGNLNQSISSRAASQDANLNPAFAGVNVPAQKQQANIQVYSGAYAELFKHLEVARVNYLNQIPLLEVIDPAAYPMKKIKMGKLKTGIIFSVAAAALLVLILWIVRLLKMPSPDPQIHRTQAQVAI